MAKRKKCKMVKNWCHCKKASSKKFHPGSFRTKTVKKGVQIVVGCPKGKWRKGRCTVGMKPVSIHYSKPYLKRKHRRCV